MKSLWNRFYNSNEHGTVNSPKNVVVHNSRTLNCNQDEKKINKLVTSTKINKSDKCKGSRFVFDNIYKFNGKKTNHQELFYGNSDLVKTVSINKVYQGKLKIWYHRSVKDHKCISETVPFEVAKVAVKVIEHSDAAENENNEPEMLHYLKDEPEIINLFGYHIDIKNKKCIMVIEWCKGGDLFSYIDSHISRVNRQLVSTIRLCDIKKIIRWIISTINKCHRLDICHSDLKLDNIMLMRINDLDSLRLIDFGAAKFIHDDGKDIEYNYICTSPHYTPPEVIDKFHMRLNCDFLNGYKLVGKNLFKIDVWQIGIIAYILIHGIYPFDSGNPNKEKKYNIIIKKIETCKDPPITTGADIDGNIFCDEHGLDFLRRTICFDPSKRCTLGELLDHPWLV